MIPSRGTADLIEATTQRRPLFDQLFLEAAPICKLPFDVQLSTFMEDRDATARIRDFIKPPPDHFAFRWRRCSREFLFFFGREAQYFHFEIGSEMGCCPGSSTNCHARKSGWRLPRFSPNSFLSFLLHNFGASAFARNAYG